MPDTSLLAYVTAGIYWALIVCWSAILVFYVREYRRLRKLNPLIATLIIVIFIDGARTLIESGYFGTWYTARTGLIPYPIFTLLTEPQFVLIPKILNLVAAVIIIGFVVRRWFGDVAQETQRHRDLARYHSDLLHAHAELQRTSAELRRSNRELEQFAYVASHDLREPLRKIVAFGDRLEARHAPTLGAEGQDYVSRMQNAARRMQALISALLAYSRVTTQAQPFVPVDLAAVADEVVSDLEVAIQQTGGRVEVGPLPTIDADPAQMRQVLQNLVSNALKFHREGEPPVVRIRACMVESPGAAPAEPARGQTMCEMTVEDNGIGFDEAHLERIFGMFQRLHGRNEYEGTGMGLAISRRVVERHGGTITAESTPGKGSKFTITLPARHTDPGGAA